MSDGLKVGIELAVMAVIAALLVAAGAYADHVVMSKRVLTLQTSYANQESERNKQLLADYADAVQARDTMQKAADAAARDASNNIQMANNETNQLRTCIDSGHGCGLRIHVAATVSGASDAAVPEAASTNDAGYAELAPDARSAYFALRTAINTVQGQLAACKGYGAQMQ